MKYLITGGSGQLGHDIALELGMRYKDANIYLPSHDVMDITNREQTLAFIESIRPDVIFHAAAYTAVDLAEEECKLCRDINVNGTKNIKDGAEKVNAKLIYVSTDYVFDGKKNGLYEVDDKVNPLSIYGQTKLLGEQIALDYPKTFIARTSWVFGINGKNFIKTMLRLADIKDEINVVSDQYGSPTYTKDLAKLLVDMSETEKYGVYHTTNDGYTNWYELAKYALNKMGKTTPVIPIKTEDYKTKASRPMNSCLSHKSLLDNGFELLPDWHDAVDRYCEEIVSLDKSNKVLERSGKNGRN